MIEFFTAAMMASSLAPLLPPPEFVYEPRSSYTLERVRDDLLEIYCMRRLDDGRSFLGCSWVKENRIFIAQSLSGVEFEIVFMHEIAHLNGWNHD